MNATDLTKARSFFDSVLAEFPVERKLACLVTTHILRDRPLFFDALSKLVRIISVTPKPRSIDRESLAILRHRYRIDRLTRSDLSIPEVLAPILDRALGDDLLFLDVGGYYSASISLALRSRGLGAVGVIEDTENGHQRYAALKEVPVPIISVARSPLKNPEDFLVGQSIVFSVEALLREQGEIPQGRRALVIGYGKLGRSIATSLRARAVEVSIHDTDPLKIVEALAHGFHVSHDLEALLNQSGLVFCATGNVSLHSDQYRWLPDGCYVATATSSDDELQTRDLLHTYRRCRVSDLISKFSSERNSFYLLNHGQAVNFVHGAVVGPFIFLVQAEILASVSVLCARKLSNGIHENGETVRRKIAKLWLEAFQPRWSTS